MVDTELPLIPQRHADAHKGSFGRALVLAGSRNMPGAACLAAEAALRSGAGLVTLVLPRSILPVAASTVTCATFLPVAETSNGTVSITAIEDVLSQAEKATCLAVGPGLSQDKETVEFVHSLLPKLGIPAIMDADALNAYAERAGELSRVTAPFVITPHPGEMARITGLSTRDVQANRLEVAQQFAKQHGCVVALKGHRTVVTDGARTYVNKTGNPGMATGGAGDVLTGMLAGLLAQGFDLYDGSKLAVYIHGVAGDIARDERGELSMTALDILDRLHLAFRRYQLEHQQLDSTA